LHTVSSIIDYFSPHPFFHESLAGSFLDTSGGRCLNIVITLSFPFRQFFLFFLMLGPDPNFSFVKRFACPQLIPVFSFFFLLLAVALGSFFLARSLFSPLPYYWKGSRFSRAIFSHAGLPFTDRDSFFFWLLLKSPPTPSSTQLSPFSLARPPSQLFT